MKKTALFIVVVLLAQLPGTISGNASGLPDEASGISISQESENYYIRPTAGDENSFVVMLPLSEVLYEYAHISYEDELELITVTCGTLDVQMETGNPEYVINGETAMLDAPPEIINGVIFVPATFFERTFGFWITESGEGVIDLFMPSFIIENI